MTITEQLHKFIEEIKDKINGDNYETLIFKVHDGRVVRFEKVFSVNLDELKIEITD